MTKRGKFGALIGAAFLTLALGSTALAAAPVYSVSVSKAAAPTTVPAGGGDVLFTIVVTNTSVSNGGPAAFKIVNVSDSLGGCTLSAPSGTGAPDSLDTGDAWTYTCTVTGVTAGTTNTVTVNACHDGSQQQCNNDNHDATGTASVTVTAAAAPTTSLTPTDTIGTAGTSGPADMAWLLVVALGVLLASIVVLSPARAKSRR